MFFVLAHVDDCACCSDDCMKLLDVVVHVVVACRCAHLKGGLYRFQDMSLEEVRLDAKVWQSHSDQF